MNGEIVQSREIKYLDTGFGSAGSPTATGMTKLINLSQGDTPDLFLQAEKNNQ
jgi:hypothetical protein